MIGDLIANPADLIKEGSDAGFVVDVIEESRRQPVIVDFWATWCGPCKTLGPALERAVLAARGAVKMVKIDIDKHPRVAGQLGVQSIPTVYGFVDGKPADGFMGSVPESQIKAFIERLTQGGEAPNEVDALLALGAESLAVSDLGGAAQAYAQALQIEPENVSALAGMAKVYLQGGEIEQARQLVAMAPKDIQNPDLIQVRAALELAQSTGDTGVLERRLAANPADHEARFELAGALAAQGQMEAAVEHLLTLVGLDLEWNEQAARKQLLKIFEAAGPTSALAKSGRRRLSALLFS